jgi:translation initiation factor 2 beta subunit (eIF-2beta)/eIF-5
MEYNSEIHGKIKAIKAKEKADLKEKNKLENYIRDCHLYRICPVCGEPLKTWESYDERVWRTNCGIKCTVCDYNTYTHSRQNLD